MILQLSQVLGCLELQVVLPTLIEKKTKGKKRVITYKLFGTSYMKQHVEVEHHELLFTNLSKFAYVNDGILKGSEEGN
jgi:hypothetical protein